MWHETKAVFDAASSDPECRCVLLTGNGRLFTAGIDLQNSFVSNDVQEGESDDGAPAVGILPEDTSEDAPDVSRRALAQFRGIQATQVLFNAIEECRVPVVACIHRACLGAGVDMVRLSAHVLRTFSLFAHFFALRALFHVHVLRTFSLFAHFFALCALFRVHVLRTFSLFAHFFLFAHGYLTVTSRVDPSGLRR